MTGTTQRDKAEALRMLHQAPPVLLLLNAWDVVSARLVEAAGFPAIATTSAGIANSLGYPDGERVPRDAMAAAVARIAAAVRVPVSADMEAGYGPAADDAAATARAALAAGAVGLNLEDGTRDPARPLADLELQLDRLRAVRRAGDEAGVRLVINARTDTYLRRVGNAGTCFAETVRRARAFREAGADCVFVPGLRDAGTIAALLRESPGPLNVLAGPGLPPVPELARLGVARLSFGSSPHRATLGLLRRMAEEVRSRGTFESVFADALSYDETNALLA